MRAAAPRAGAIGRGRVRFRWYGRDGFVVVYVADCRAAAERRSGGCRIATGVALRRRLTSSRRSPPTPYRTQAIVVLRFDNGRSKFSSRRIKYAVTVRAAEEVDADKIHAAAMAAAEADRARCATEEVDDEDTSTV